MMRMHVRVAILALSLSSVAASQESHNPDSLRTLLAAQSALRVFEGRWRTEIAALWPEPTVTPFAQCEQGIGTDWCYGPNNGGIGYSRVGTIPNATRFSRDLVPGFARKKARKLLGALIDTLKVMRKRIPGDQWIAGQLVRLSLEKAEPQEALDEAFDCTSDRQWCNALIGHVLHQIGNMEAYADDIWTQTLNDMTLEERCRWLDPSDVIKSDSLRRAVAAMDCAARVRFAEVLWWLSDPLYLTRGNERRSEHLSRQVALRIDAFANQRLDSARADLLVRGLRQTRYEDSVLAGGPVASNLPRRDASDLARTRVTLAPQLGYEELVRRLGVPGYLHSARPEPGSPPQLFALFPKPRFSFVPAAAALSDLTSAPPEAWKIDDDEQYEFQATVDREYVDIDYQVAFFHRGDSARLVAASDLEAQPQLSKRGALAGLFVRRDPTEPGLLASRTFRGPLYIQSVTIPWQRTYVSLEILSRDSSWAGRARFGAGPPAMPSQRLTMSDVMLVDPRTHPPTNLEDAEPLALGSSRIRKGSSVGVFWEMYGLTSADSGTFSVAVSGQRSGILATVTRAISGQNAPDAPAVNGVLPRVTGSAVAAHSINLDLKALSPGRYTLAVEVRANGQQPVTTLRAFEILAR